MKLLVFSVRDSKAEFYAPPFYARTVGEAVRIFADTANNPESALNHHPVDFVLYHVGSFDQETGRFTAQDPIGYGAAAEHMPTGPFQAEIPLEVEA
ncbi:nonstructural protein [Microviridae sp.]|nr:nonstructural protein [Microviridae sp.]